MPRNSRKSSCLPVLHRSLLASAFTLAMVHFSLAQAATPTVSAGALPTNGSVIDGTASATVNGSTMVITAGNPGPGHNAIIVWGSQGGASINPGASGGFNVGSQATLIFKATDSSSDVLNVDTSGNPSVLAGHLVLNSNNVFIANGNGIFVGSDAVINISSLNQSGNGGLGLIADNLGSSATALKTYADSIEQMIGSDSVVAGSLPLWSGSVTIASGAFVGNNSSSDDPEVIIAGSDINVDGSINTYAYDIAPTGLQNTLNIGSTGSLGATAGNVNIEPAVTDGSNQQQMLNITDQGIMGAQSTMEMGGDGLYIQNITGSGSLAVGSLILNNLDGSVNNITSGQILANGFQIDTVPSAYNQIVINAVGQQSQGINLRINGSVLLSTGNTVAVLPNGQAPANANSKLVVEATGDLTVSNYGSLGVKNPDPYNPSDDSLQFPGLIYLQSNSEIDDYSDDIVNAYTTNAPVGYGVFLIAPVIQDQNPIYANGGRGVVFAAPFNGISYPYATVNGDQKSGMPSIYFLTSNGPQIAQTFPNSNGSTQEYGTFYTFTPGS